MNKKLCSRDWVSPSWLEKDPLSADDKVCWSKERNWSRWGFFGPDVKHWMRRMKSKLFWFVCELTSASGLQFCGVVGGLLWCVVAFTCSLCVSPCCMWFSTRVLQQRSRLIRTCVFGPDSVTDSSLRGFSLPSSKSLKVTEMNQKVLQNQSNHKCLTHFCFYWINRPE